MGGSARRGLVASCGIVAATLIAGCSGADGATASAPPDATGAGEASAPAFDAAGDVVASDAGAATDATLDALATCAPVASPPPLLFYDLRAAPFPDASTPSVAVHVPPGFDPSNRPGLLVFFHGFDNCVTNVVGAVDTPCTDGGAARAAMHLVEQIDAARVNAILVAIELEVDVATGNPGQLATPGDFRALVHELLTEHLDAVLGCPLDVGSLDRVVVSSHSGGYEAAASVLAFGDVPSVREVDLLDSLYGETPIFDDWVGDAAPRFDPSRPDSRRWVDLYTSGGGTAASSRAMAASAEGWFGEAGMDGAVFFDDTTDDLDGAAYAHPVLFKLSGLAHDDVPRYYVEPLARAAGFASIP
jgi:hypothetical protein